MADATKKRCRDCGEVTYRNTTGVPGASCPARAPIYATHRWEVVE